jgi:hypothetical protein
MGQCVSEDCQDFFKAVKETRLSDFLTANGRHRSRRSAVKLRKNGSRSSGWNSRYCQ